MSYQLHIKHAAPIPLEDWETAVAAVPGLRLFAEPFYARTNPTTGETIRMPVGPADAEVYFPNDNSWRPVFRWREGSASFNAPSESCDLANPAWAAAVALVCSLGARIHGDDGEEYPVPVAKK